MLRKIEVRLLLHVCVLFMVTCCLIPAASAASSQWNEQVLYSFQGGTDGATPTGAVVFDKAGNLYGATENGGSSACLSPGDCGTVYKLTPPTQTGGAWTETVLYVFKGYAAGTEPHRKADWSSTMPATYMVSLVTAARDLVCY